MKKKIVASIGLIMSVSFIAIVSCKKKDDTAAVKPDFDRQAMLANIGSNLIVPSYNNLKITTAALQTAVQDFNNNTDSSHLVVVQNAWKDAVNAWKSCESFTFGFEADSMLSDNIDYWPANGPVIETEISGTAILSQTHINTSGSSRKGFSAIEYLIFDKVNGDASLVTNYTTAANASRRKDYLKALADNIKSKSESCYNSWATGGYLATFQSSTGTDITSSTGIVLNQMIVTLEVVINNKIGYPLGMKTSGAIQPNSVEAPLSDASLAMIRNNVKALENTFLGKSFSLNGTGADNSGFDDYLNYAGAQYNGGKLTDAINAQFADFYSKLDAIPPPLQHAVASNKTQVTAAYNSLKQLLVLMKADMASSLGITITFSDNDGD